MKNENNPKMSKREAITVPLLTVFLLLLIIGGVIFSAIRGAQNKKAEAERLAKLIPVVTDYSKGLDDNGFIAGINEDDYVKLGFDPTENMKIKAADVEFTDSDLNVKIDDLRAEHKKDDEEDLPEFNDAFVKERLESDLTAEQYKQKIRDDEVRAKKIDWIGEYINSTVDAFDIPEDYIYTYAGVLKAMDERQVEVMNQFYLAYTGSIAYDSPYDMRQMSEDEYEEYVLNEATRLTIEMLAYQKIFKALNMSVSDAEYEAYLTEKEITDPSVYGKGYIMKSLNITKVNEYLAEHAEIVTE